MLLLFIKAPVTQGRVADAADNSLGLLSLVLLMPLMLLMLLVGLLLLAVYITVNVPASAAAGVANAAGYVSTYVNK